MRLHSIQKMWHALVPWRRGGVLIYQAYVKMVVHQALLSEEKTA